MVVVNQHLVGIQSIHPYNESKLCHIKYNQVPGVYMSGYGQTTKSTNTIDTDIPLDRGGHVQGKGNYIYRHFQCVNKCSGNKGVCGSSIYQCLR